MSIDDFRGPFRWLSNFHECKIIFIGKEYNSVEHAYQAAKTFSDEEQERIRSAITPGKARRLGQKVTLRPDWESIKLDVMRLLLAQKFSHPELKKRLLETDDQHLIEGNTWGDRFWGVHEGRGLNYLGRLLMDIRERLRREASE